MAPEAAVCLRRIWLASGRIDLYWCAHAYTIGHPEIGTWPNLGRAVASVRART